MTDVKSFCSGNCSKCDPLEKSPDLDGFQIQELREVIEQESLLAEDSHLDSERILESIRGGAAVIGN